MEKEAARPGPWMIGYHYCADPEKRKAFVDGRELIVAGKASWLGPGMYFWDNLGNAKYWRTRRRPAEGAPPGGIVRAGIDLGQRVLDLTDPDMLEDVGPPLQEIAEMYSGSGRRGLTVGFLLGFLFDEAKRARLPRPLQRRLDPVIGRFGSVGVIKADGHYPIAPGAAKWLTGIVVRTPCHLEFANKRIFCVREGSAVLWAEPVTGMDRKDGQWRRT